MQLEYYAEIGANDDLLNTELASTASTGKLADAETGGRKEGKKKGERRKEGGDTEGREEIEEREAGRKERGAKEKRRGKQKRGREGEEEAGRTYLKPRHLRDGSINAEGSKRGPVVLKALEEARVAPPRIRQIGSVRCNPTPLLALSNLTQAL